MRLYLINPANPFDSNVRLHEGRWNRYRVREPVGLLEVVSLGLPDELSHAASKVQQSIETSKVVP